MNPHPPRDLVDEGVPLPARVRGPVVGRHAPVHLCRHCGAPLAPAVREAGFCCSGCAYVFRLVHEHGLEGFYKIREAVVAPVGDTVFQPGDFAWLAELQQQAEEAASGSAGPGPRGHVELQLEIQGISCAGCVWLIERLFHQQTGSLEIETNAQLGSLRLRWVPGQFDAAGFARKLHAFGYLVGPPGAEPVVLESRLLVRRIGLCAAFSMNVMLFTLPAYFGMAATAPYARLFSTLGMVFATLSLLVGGGYFINRAARALRDGVLHIDLPIALGIIGAYAGSLYGWLSGHGQFLYFDFIGTFILLMLVGRWAQVGAVERNRRRLLTFQARPRQVRVAGGDGLWTDRPVESLRAGDVFVVRSGQVVPVEAQLESGSATFGTAWITGEADPRDCGAGARLPAGAVNLGRGEVKLRAAQPWSDSMLGQLLRPVGRNDFRHRFLERIVGGYLVGVLLVSVAAGFGWWLATHDAARTWSVVTAVLVVSCPCAIGLSFPLADEMATIALRRCGVFVREGDLWPRLARIRKIIFDKTGTLTLETPVLRNPEALSELGPAARSALLALVRDNPHPVSQSLYENLLSRGLEVGVLPAGGEITEIPGSGVVLKAKTGAWSLGRPGWRGQFPPALLLETHDTELACDGLVVAGFRFADAVRDDAAAEIAALQARGFEAHILSGDRAEKVNAIADALGIPRSRALSQVQPHEKAEQVRALDRRDTLMVGDGANDSLAFDAAFVRGTPVIHRGVLEGKADFYYLGRGLSGLRQLFAVNAARRRTQFWLLVFSVSYNLVAVGLAVLGHMNPMLAAILMPVSSLLSLAIVGGGMRRWLRG